MVWWRAFMHVDCHDQRQVERMDLCHMALILRQARSCADTSSSNSASDLFLLMTLFLILRILQILGREMSSFLKSIIVAAPNKIAHPTVITGRLWLAE